MGGILKQKRFVKADVIQQMRSLAADDEVTVLQDSQDQTSQSQETKRMTSITSSDDESTSERDGEISANESWLCG